MARFFADQSPPVSEIRVIHESGAYGDQLAGLFIQNFKANAGKATVATFKNSTERDTAVIDAGKAPETWVVFVSSQGKDVAAFINAAASLSGYGSKKVFLTDSAANKDLFKNTASSKAFYPQVRGSRPGLPSGNVYDQFRAAYNAAFSKNADDFSFVAHSYDATWLVALGAAWSFGQTGSLSGKGIAQGLRQLSAPVGRPFPACPHKPSAAPHEPGGRKSRQHHRSLRFPRLRSRDRRNSGPYRYMEDQSGRQRA